MKQDFFQYIQNEFNFSDEELKNFENSCFLPLKKSIRINTNKISVEDFKKLAKKNNWELTETSLGKNTFYIDRFEDLNNALGNTNEHQKGFFYVQELAASSSPFYLSGDKIDYGNYSILDMSASPGGKTTQLSEYYPNSLIVANEINKERFKGLFYNLDRMGALNVVCTNYDGRFFKENIEMFDKVLLDAPCSGEGTAYKTQDTLKFWNIKNIKSISKLQISLLDSAVKTLKIGGELVYSTCTLNKIENEKVIETIIERYNDSLEIISLNNGKLKIENTIVIPATVLRHSEASRRQKAGIYKNCKNNLIDPRVKHEDDNIDTNKEGQIFIRNWPHIDKTGGFFVAKIKKISKILENEKKEKYFRGSLYDQKIERKNNFTSKRKEVIQNFEKLSSKESKFLEKFIDENYKFKIDYKKFYKYKDEIFMINKDISELSKKLFFYKIGVSIGKYKNNNFIPNEFLENLR